MNELDYKYHQKKMDEIQKKLEDGVKNIFSSEKYKEYIKAMSKLHNYSINNRILIASQFPGATMVCGFKTWKNEFERNVDKGQKGIMIYRPVKIKDKNSNHNSENTSSNEEKELIIDDSEKKEMVTFRTAYVFDVSQTSGKPVPSLVDELEDVVDSYDEMIDILMEISPVPVSFEKINSGANGFYSPVEEKIVIDKDLSELHSIKTLIHEIAHAKLNHGNKDLDATKDKNTQEVQAESIAYWVTQALGYDTSEYSFGYIAGWSKDKSTTELKESLEIIKQTSEQIFDSIKEVIEQEYIYSKSICR